MNAAHQSTTPTEQVPAVVPEQTLRDLGQGILSTTSRVDFVTPAVGRTRRIDGQNLTETKYKQGVGGGHWHYGHQDSQY